MCVDIYFIMQYTFTEVSN